MQKIVSGSKVQNATNLQEGSTVDSIIDRSMQLFSEEQITWSGTQISFTQPIQIEFPLEAGNEAINQILVSDSPLTLNNGQAVIARLNRTSGTTTLVAGTYPNLSPGQYAIVAISSLNQIDIDRKDHVVMFHRRDTTASLRLLKIPLHRQLLQAGQSAFLGASGGTGGSSLGFQDHLGTGDGTTTIFGPLTKTPMDGGSVEVYVDSRFIDNSQWSLSGLDIVFTTPPSAAQSIDVWYLYAGQTTASVEMIEYHTVTSGEATAKSFTLAGTPTDGTKVVLDIVHGTSQRYATDFTVSGNTLSWSGLGLDGFVPSGTVFRIQYWVGAPPANENVEYHTVTSGEATAKSITLANTPLTPANVLLNIVHGTSEQYAVDYTVTGNTLSWSGLGLDGFVPSGTVFRIYYFS